MRERAPRFAGLASSRSRRAPIEKEGNTRKRRGKMKSLHCERKGPRFAGLTSSRAPGWPWKRMETCRNGVASGGATLHCEEKGPPVRMSYVKPQPQGGHGRGWKHVETAWQVEEPHCTVRKRAPRFAGLTSSHSPRVPMEKEGNMSKRRGKWRSHTAL